MDSVEQTITAPRHKFVPVPNRPRKNYSHHYSGTYVNLRLINMYHW